MGDEKLLLQYEIELRKHIQEWCNQIFELLTKSNEIKTEREQMKCLMALANNDLLFFSKKLKYEENDNTLYNDMLEKIDDGFLIRKRRSKI